MSSEIRRVAVKVGVCRKEGTEHYGSVGASCEVEVEVEGTTAEALSAARDRWIGWCNQTVDEAIARQRAALPAPAARPSAEEPPRRKERQHWDTAGHGEEARRSPGGGGGGRNQDGPPRSGGALYARLRDLEEHGQEGLVKRVSRWAKRRGNDRPMRDWDRDEVKDGWREAERLMEAFEESDRLQGAY